MTARAPTLEEKALLRELFPVRPAAPCGDCGGVHWRACPRIRRQAWSQNGTVRTEVEYWRHYDDSEIVWPEEVWDDDA
jgi:hypothetical protein